MCCDAACMLISARSSLEYAMCFEDPAVASSLRVKGMRPCEIEVHGGHPFEKAPWRAVPHRSSACLLPLSVVLLWSMDAVDADELCGTGEGKDRAG